MSVPTANGTTQYPTGEGGAQMAQPWEGSRPIEGSSVIKRVPRAPSQLQSREAKAPPEKQSVLTGQWAVLLER